MDAAFERWLAAWRDEELDGPVAAHFLSSAYLRAAFDAGVVATCEVLSAALPASPDMQKAPAPR
jgi:hypothetical protein